MYDFTHVLCRKRVLWFFVDTPIGRMHYLALQVNHHIINPNYQGNNLTGPQCSNNPVPAVMDAIYCPENRKHALNFTRPTCN